jgi:hypothetical protein
MIRARGKVDGWNVISILQAVGDDSGMSYGLTVVCPICGSNYQHSNDPFTVDGQDSYKAWCGRGDLIVIPFWGECGSSWELCIGFHKGDSVAFVNILALCEVNYQTYIQSYLWKARATTAKKRAGWRCQVCNKSAAETTLDAHHRTYERLGNERPEDITVLCRNCHELYEKAKRNGVGR